MTKIVPNPVAEPIGPAPFLVNDEGGARLLGIGRTLFRQMDSDGRLGPMSVRLGDRRLWCSDELRAWARHHCPSRERWVRLWGDGNGDGGEK